MSGNVILRGCFLANCCYVLWIYLHVPMDVHQGQRRQSFLSHGRPHIRLQKSQHTNGTLAFTAGHMQRCTNPQDYMDVDKQQAVAIDATIVRGLSMRSFQKANHCSSSASRESGDGRSSVKNAKSSGDWAFSLAEATSNNPASALEWSSVNLVPISTSIWSRKGAVNDLL